MGNDIAKPSYYKFKDGYDIIDAAFETGDGIAFCRWSIISYIKRAGLKVDTHLTHKECVLRDLYKAKEYIERWIQHAKSTIELSRVYGVDVGEYEFNGSTNTMPESGD